jgi:hypothetical protein
MTFAKKSCRGRWKQGLGDYADDVEIIMYKKADDDDDQQQTLSDHSKRKQASNNSKRTEGPSVCDNHRCCCVVVVGRVARQQGIEAASTGKTNQSKLMGVHMGQTS